MDELDDIENRLMNALYDLKDIQEKGKNLKIKHAGHSKEDYISMPICVGSQISCQVNSNKDCIKIGFKFFKEGLVCFVNSIKCSFQFNKLHKELIKKQVLKELK